ncbi:hypothetical protein ACP70R_026876 [Stipagrostis hirtigluma subsp. patula]
MRAEMMVCNAVHCGGCLLVLLIFFQFMHPSQGFKLRGGDGEEKVPLTVIVPDPSPVMSSAPLAAPPPLSGGGGDDMRPRLPTERWRRGHGEVRRGAAHAPAAGKREAHAPKMAASSAGPARAPASAPAAPVVEAEAPAPAPDSGSGAAFISSSPAVPVPRGVTDTATILPMPAPGEKRQEVGAATSVPRPCTVPLLMLGALIMMASFGL